MLGPEEHFVGNPMWFIFIFFQTLLGGQYFGLTYRKFSFLLLLNTVEAILWLSEVDGAIARESQKLSFKRVPSIRFTTTVKYDLH